MSSKHKSFWLILIRRNLKLKKFGLRTLIDLLLDKKIIIKMITIIILIDLMIFLNMSITEMVAWLTFFKIYKFL